MKAQPNYPPSLNGVDEGAFQVIELVEITQSAAHYRVRLADTRALATLVVMGTRLSDRPEELLEFAREIRCVNEIAHPGLARVVGHGRSDRIGSYVVYENTDGMSLGRRLRQRGALSVRAATSLLRCIAAAVDETHSRGICHGSLSVDNIMLVPVGPRRREIKLLGYGLARLLPFPFVNNGTTFPGATDLLVYASPEQCAGEPASTSADIYSLGVIAYEMLYGRPPFNSGNTRQLIHKHLHAQPPRPRRGGFLVPDRVEAVVFKALAKRPEDRFPSVADFRRALPMTIPPELSRSQDEQPARIAVSSQEVAERQAAVQGAGPWRVQPQPSDERVSRLVDEMIREDTASPPPLPPDVAARELDRNIQVETGAPTEIHEVDPADIEVEEEDQLIPCEVVVPWEASTEDQAPPDLAPEEPEPEQHEPEQHEPEQHEPEQHEPEQPEPEQPTAEEPKPEQPEAEQPEPEQPEPEQPTAEEPKAEEPEPELSELREPEAEEPEHEQPDLEEAQPGEPDKVEDGGAAAPEANSADSELQATAPEQAEPAPDPEAAVEPEMPRPEQPALPAPPPTFRARNIVGFITVMATMGLSWLGVVMLIDWSHETPETEPVPAVKTGSTGVSRSAPVVRPGVGAETTTPSSPAPKLAAMLEPDNHTPAVPSRGTGPASGDDCVGVNALTAAGGRCAATAPKTLTSTILPGLEPATRTTTTPAVGETTRAAVAVARPAVAKMPALPRTSSRARRSSRARIRPPAPAAGGKKSRAVRPPPAVARRVVATPKKPLAMAAVSVAPAPAAAPPPSPPRATPARPIPTSAVPPLLLQTFRKKRYRNAFYQALIHLETSPNHSRLLAIKGISACHLSMASVARKVHARLRGHGKSELEQACRDNGISVAN